MKISKKIYKKIIQCSDLQIKHRKVSNEVEEYLIEKGIDMDDLRNHDEPFVDMVDYGSDFCSKEKLEIMFSKYKSAFNKEKKS